MKKNNKSKNSNVKLFTMIVLFVIAIGACIWMDNSLEDFLDKIFENASSTQLLVIIIILTIAYILLEIL